MQITSVRVSNTNYVQIYLTQEEMEEEETKDIIKNYKKQKCNLALFETGEENYPEILKKIVSKQVELNQSES